MTKPQRPSIHALLALALIGIAPAAEAAPPNTDEWFACDMNADSIELGTGENGCCTDEDQDGYIDTCWVCDENHENCVSEELGEDLRAPRPGIGGLGPNGGGAAPNASQPATGLPQLQLQLNIQN